MTVLTVGVQLDRLDSETFQQFPFRDGMRWDVAGDVPDVAVIDCTDAAAMPVIVALRALFDGQRMPIVGVIPVSDSRRYGLFLSAGGTRVVASVGEATVLLSAMQPRTDSLADVGFPVVMSIDPRQTSRRYLRLVAETEVHARSTRLFLGDLPFTEIVQGLLEHLRVIAPVHLAILVVGSSQRLETYVLPQHDMYRHDYMDMLAFCLNDVYRYFSDLDLERRVEHFFIGERTDFDKMRISAQKISSYFHVPLRGANDEIYGTLHLGHLSNNYFGAVTAGRITAYLERLQRPLEHALAWHNGRLREERLRSIFARFVPPEIIPRLVAQESNRDEEPVERREITVLFTDIRSFTTLTESNGAQAVVEFLNRHFEVMVNAIKAHGGTIDKFIGDAIVALFGVPVPFPDSATRAVRAAQAMIAALPSVDTAGLVLPAGGYAIGIGVHEADAIVGNIGSPDKRDYTAIGDVIAVAEELEGTTKHHGTPILVSSQIRRRVGDTIAFREVIAPGTQDEFPDGCYTPVAHEAPSGSGNV